MRNEERSTIDNLTVKDTGRVKDLVNYGTINTINNYGKIGDGDKFGGSIFFTSFRNGGEDSAGLDWVEQINYPGIINTINNYGEIHDFINYGDASKPHENSKINNLNNQGKIYSSRYDIYLLPSNDPIAHIHNKGNINLSNYYLEINKTADGFNGFLGYSDPYSDISHLVINDMSNDNNNVRFLDSNTKILLNVGSNFEFNKDYLLDKLIVKTDGNKYNLLYADGSSVSNLYSHLTLSQAALDADYVLLQGTASNAFKIVPNKRIYSNTNDDIVLDGNGYHEVTVKATLGGTLRNDTSIDKFENLSDSHINDFNNWKGTITTLDNYGTIGSGYSSMHLSNFMNSNIIGTLNNYGEIYNFKSNSTNAKIENLNNQGKIYLSINRGYISHLDDGFPINISNYHLEIDKNASEFNAFSSYTEGNVDTNDLNDLSHLIINADVDSSIKNRIKLIDSNSKFLISFGNNFEVNKEYSLDKLIVDTNGNKYNLTYKDGGDVSNLYSHLALTQGFLDADYVITQGTTDYFKIIRAKYFNSDTNIDTQLYGVNYNEVKVNANVNAQIRNTTTIDTFENQTGNIMELNNFGLIKSLDNQNAITTLNNITTIESLENNGNITTLNNNFGTIETFENMGDIATLNNNGLIKTITSHSSNDITTLNNINTIESLENNGHITTLNNDGLIKTITNSAEIITTLNNTGTINAFNNSALISHLNNQGRIYISNSSDKYAHIHNSNSGSINISNYQLEINKTASDFNNFSGYTIDNINVNDLSHLIINNTGDVKLYKDNSKILLIARSGFELGVNYSLDKLIVDTD
ncbi:hypothetical protein CCY99_08650 [Helicobacter sp. 16-1353]|uniref:hypothetical protein n=1 Tax=Helicobacter sp. 16-1353 TaxID=2004996 RepID=UPI000DCE22BA|nr:hypothetical protein [Helicobacter sp. 16-1353]RAX51624.1 hypothetical protein CCY99_08650 [Helicobacter sp. 16-1353]